MPMETFQALAGNPRKYTRLQEIVRHIARVGEKLRFVMMGQNAWRIIRRGKYMTLEVLCTEEIMGIEMFAIHAMDQTWGNSRDMSGLPSRMEEFVSR